jgi:hypothetical protein
MMILIYAVGKKLSPGLFKLFFCSFFYTPIHRVPFFLCLFYTNNYAKGDKSAALFFWSLMDLRDFLRISEPMIWIYSFQPVGITFVCFNGLLSSKGFFLFVLLIGYMQRCA